MFQKNQSLLSKLPENSITAGRKISSRWLSTDIALSARSKISSRSFCLARRSKNVWISLVRVIQGYNMEFVGIWTTRINQGMTNDVHLSFAANRLNLFKPSFYQCFRQGVVKQRILFVRLLFIFFVFLDCDFGLLLFCAWFFFIRT